MLSALDLMSEVKYFCPKADVVRPIVKIRKVSRFIVVLQLLVTVQRYARAASHRTSNEAPNLQIKQQPV